MPSTPLLTIAHTPAVRVDPSATVREATLRMVKERVGAVAVVEDDQLVGIFTERDLMVKVVEPGLSADEVRVGEVMVRGPVTLPPDATRSAALDLMVAKHFRHVPLTDADDRVLGMLSIRHLFQHQLDRLKEQMDSLEAYLGADGPGG